MPARAQLLQGLIPKTREEAPAAWDFSHGGMDVDATELYAWLFAHKASKLMLGIQKMCPDLVPVLTIRTLANLPDAMKFDLQFTESDGDLKDFLGKNAALRSRWFYLVIRGDKLGFLSPGNRAAVLSPLSMTSISLRSPTTCMSRSPATSRCSASSMSSM